MNFDLDYIVIGSGFGGSVMTCRLAEKGYQVCVLERGRKWNMHEFPRRPSEMQQNIFWDPQDQKFGLMEFRDSPESDVMTLTASGLGGGSLIYANVLYRMPAEFFHGWPAGVSRDMLEPYYDKVISTMEAKPYPFESVPYYRNTPKTAAFKNVTQNLEQAEDMTEKASFQLPPLAVRFEGEFPGHQTKNSHGAIQSRCTKCGECDIGCNIHAKNTLDLNYLFRAHHQFQAEIRTQAEVTDIQEIPGGFEVSYIIPEFPQETVKLKSRKVIVSAGSVGSTSLLLKLKKKGSLPHLNKWLGKKWCGNGDLLGFVLNTTPDVEPSNGPVITSAIEYKYKSYPDGYPHGMYIEDAGFPIGLSWYMSGKLPQFSSIKGALQLLWMNLKRYFMRLLGLHDAHAEVNVGDDFVKALDRAEFARRFYVLLGMGRDRADGEMSLREDNEPILNWKLKPSELHYSRLRGQMKKIAAALEGIFIDNPLTLLNKVVAVHPLGGCPMGDTAETGFVNTQGEVFGYEGLYVIDGSIIPTSIGPNPSLTIAALAEHIAEKIPVKKLASATKESESTP